MATQTVFNFPSKMTHTFELRYPRIQLKMTPGFQVDTSFLNQGVFKSLSTKMTPCIQLTPPFLASWPGERGGSVVECRTPEREVRGSRPTAAVLCPWARHFTPRKYWLITQEAMAPSRHDWKIVDWDVKLQHNQPTNHFDVSACRRQILKTTSPFHWCQENLNTRRIPPVWQAASTWSFHIG